MSITTRAVMLRWLKCHDTWMIAQHFGVSEAEVYRIVAAERDRRHRLAEEGRRSRERLRLIRQQFAASPF